MLELPESIAFCKILKETVLNKQIKNVIANSSEHKFAFFSCDPCEYPSLLLNKNILDVCSYGGFIELALNEDTSLLFGDGVNLRYYTDAKKLPLKHQLFIEFTDQSFLVCTISMYGGLWAIQKSTYDNPYYLIAKQKPSPLTKEFDADYFMNLLKGTKQTLSVKAFLATEQRIPGLGNGVLHDILYHAKIHPKTKLCTLSDENIHSLFSAVKNTLKEMAEQGGRNTEKDIFGNAGGYQTILSAKTYKDQQVDCKHVIKREAYLGGNIYYCPICQCL